MNTTDTKSFQHFKFTLPILKTRIAVVKDESGNDIEKKYVEGVASSTDLDLHGDRMDPSAIKTMADSLKFHIIRLNAEHDTSWQSELGDISKLDVSEDSRLLIEAELNDMSKSKDLWYAITELNKKLGLSIGGYVKEYEMVKEEFKNEESGEMETKWVRHYKNIELDHIAVTSSPANPKTWVGAIAKSIQEDSQILAKKLEAEEIVAEAEEVDTAKELEAAKIKNDTMETKKEKQLRDIARNIVRAIQNLEADLLLELTYAGLNILSESQVKLLDSLLIERNKSMDKNVSLEAEEAKKADTAAKPEGVTVETPATPENESKEEVTPKEEPKEGEETETPAEPAAPLAEEKPAEEKPVESEPTKEPKKEPETEVKSEKAAPKDGDACNLPDGSKGTIKGGKCVADTTKSEGSSGSEGEDEKKDEGEVETPSPEGKPEDAEKPSEEKPEDKTEDKSTEQSAELLKSIQNLTGQMTKILETNETLAKRVAELESQPATRKTIELEKGVGDDDGEVIDGKTLKQEMEEKIAQVRKDNYGNPNLFAMTQKIRAEYAKKIRG